MGPEPTLLSRREVDALYEMMQAVVHALSQLHVDYIVTGGSLLGAMRQHSILFCDDDIDIAIILDDGESDNSNNAYHTVSTNLQTIARPNFLYQTRPWEGGDRVRPKRMKNVFVDLFVLRRYNNMDELKGVIGIKKNGQAQSDQYVQGIVQTIQDCATSAQGETTTPLFPFWHFNTRKAIEMWPKEVYREKELFPLCRSLRFGPLTGIQGPRMPVLLLKRAFGQDCFELYYQRGSHQTSNKQTGALLPEPCHESSDGELLPLVSKGGQWEGGKKQALLDIHYLPMHLTARTARRPTMHNKEQLLQYLEAQTSKERSVRQVCVPRLASFVDCDEMYYQAFPCVRVVQPNEFSIGPHSDLSYGHSPFSTNFYVPLTKIEDSSSAVFLETRPGSEDWHPILGDYGLTKFAGGVFTHWTTENKSRVTRLYLLRSFRNSPV